MKDNLHSARLLFLVTLVLSAGFVDLVGANDYDYNFSKFTENKTGKVPEIEYPIWGYTGNSYTFTVNYTVPPESSENNITMVFYWDSWGNKSYNESFVLDNKSRSEWNRSNTWYKPDLYGISVGIFEESENGDPKPVNISYWMPIDIKDEKDTKIEVQDFFMWDEKKGLDGNKSEHGYNVSNLTSLSRGSGKNGSHYCVYVNDHYAFSAFLNASGQKTRVEKDEKIWAEFEWGDNSSDGTRRKAPGELHNYTHEWDKTGKENVSVRAVKGDYYNESNNIYSDYSNRSILIIKDPKNFINSPRPSISPIIEPLSNLQNWGIFLVATGLMILFFTYTKNKVPVEISLFGLKPLRLKSVDSFAGIFAFVAGMYLYFIFGRCPWDIPIVGGIDSLANAYFGVLYYDYSPEKSSSIPFLSILLGLVIVFALSVVIYLGPVFKGELKPGKHSGEKGSSTPIQPEPDPHPVEKRMHLEELTALIEKEKDPVILQQLYFVRFRYMGDSVEKAASMRGISVGKALNLQELWNESGYKGFRSERLQSERLRSERKGENISLQELTALIENEMDTRVLRALYFIRLRYLRNSVETAASKLGISEGTGQLLENVWKEKGYEGIRELELEGRGG